MQLKNILAPLLKYRRFFSTNNPASVISSVCLPNPSVSYAYTRSYESLDPSTLGFKLTLAAQSSPSKVALISRHEDVSYTFEQLDKKVTRIASALSKGFNLKHGDVVALWSANSVSSIILQYACARLGLILCTLNPSYKGPELEYSLKKSGAKILFLPGKGSQQESVNSFWQILTSSSLSNTQLTDAIILDGDVSKDKASIKLAHLDELEKSTTSLEPLDEGFNSDSPFIIMFTSGTTGLPKGAVLSHSNLINNAHLMSLRLSLKQPGAIACIPVPLFHVFGMVYGSITMSVAQVPIVLTGYKYSVTALLEAIKETKSSHLMIVPAMTVDIANRLEQTGDSLPSLTTIITGSAPTPPQVAKKFLDKVPSAKYFYIRYGSTETGGCMSMPFEGDLPESTISNVGAPLDLTEMKVCDPKSGKVVPISAEGEVWARGHHVMLGYWKDVEKTNESIENGWFKTGDMGTMDKNGRINLVGRKKELIIRGGENIYPKEIENLLHQHPSILEAFACGVPDERMGEEVCAWVKLKDSADKVTPEEVRNFCSDKIASFKVPKYILLVDEFPRTPTGKAQKFLMTEKSCEILGLSKK